MKKCKKCGKQISFYSKLCKKCYLKTLKGSGNPMFGKKRPDLGERNKIMNLLINQVKENNGNWKGGEESRKRFCINCGKKLNNTAIYNDNERCKSCSKKGRLNINFGIPPKHSLLLKYKNIWMRSSWEVEFAQILDDNNIKWQYEPKTFDLIDKTYTPDFYLPETNEYIEIKGWFTDYAKNKIYLLKKLYPFIKLRVFSLTKGILC